MTPLHADTMPSRLTETRIAHGHEPRPAQAPSQADKPKYTAAGKGYFRPEALVHMSLLLCFAEGASGASRYCMLASMHHEQLSCSPRSRS